MLGLVKKPNILYQFENVLKYRHGMNSDINSNIDIKWSGDYFGLKTILV